MINSLKQKLRPRTLREIAESELLEAERKLLEAHTGLEYANAMVKYNADRITRLRHFLATQDVK